MDKSDRRLFIAIDLGKPGDEAGWAMAEVRDGQVIIIDSGSGQVPSEHLSTVLVVEDVEEFRTWGPPAYERRLSEELLSAFEPLAIKVGDDTIRGDRIGGPPPHTLKSYNRRRSGR